MKDNRIGRCGFMVLALRVLWFILPLYVFGKLRCYIYKRSASFHKETLSILSIGISFF